MKHREKIVATLLLYIIVCDLKCNHNISAKDFMEKTIEIWMWAGAEDSKYILWNLESTRLLKYSSLGRHHRCEKKVRHLYSI